MNRQTIACNLMIALFITGLPFSSRADLYITANDVGGSAVIEITGRGFTTAGLNPIVGPSSSLQGVQSFNGIIAFSGSTAVTGVASHGNYDLNFAEPGLPSFGPGTTYIGPATSTGGSAIFLSGAFDVIAFDSSRPFGPNSVVTHTYAGNVASLAIDTTPQQHVLANGQTIFYFTPPRPIDTQVAPPAVTTDFDAIGQIITSGLPANGSLNHIGQNLNRVATREFGNRLFRNRTRYEDPDRIVTRGSSFDLGRDVAASRFLSLGSRLKQDTLSGNTSISLSPQGGAANRASSLPDFGAPTLSDSNPFLAVEQPAGESVAGTLANGERWALWAGTDYGRVELDDLGGASTGVESNTYSSTIGLDYVVSDAILIGFGWSHLWNDNAFTSGIGDVDVEGDSVTGYVTYFKNNLWADLLYSNNSSEADIRRNTGLGSTVQASPELESHEVSLNLGYNFGIDGGRIVHGPTFGASYVDGSIDGYTETGDPRSNGQFAGQNYESLITRVGWQVNWQEESSIGTLRPQFRIGYGRENVDQNQTTAAALIPNAANNNTFVGIANGTSTAPGEGWMELGAGLGIDLGPRSSVLFDYQTQIFRENATVQFGSVSLQMKF